MDESASAKVWYVTHSGEQFGPVSIDDLKYEVERGQLNPRLDMVWREGMEDWIPSGQVDGLFRKKEAARGTGIIDQPAESVKRKPPTHVSSSDERAKRYFEDKAEWPGSTRRTYIFIFFILPVLVGWGLANGMGFLEANLGEKFLPIALIVLMLLVVFVMISVTLNRFQNLAMSRWWFFGLSVPLLNYWLGYRLFACPAGYAVHKRLGGAGWFLAIVYWLPMIGVIALVVFGALKGPDATRSIIDEGFAKIGVDLEELQKKAEEEETPPEADSSR